MVWKRGDNPVISFTGPASKWHPDHERVTPIPCKGPDGRLMGRGEGRWLFEIVGAEPKTPRVNDANVLVAYGTLDDAKRALHRRLRPIATNAPYVTGYNIRLLSTHLGDTNYAIDWIETDRDFRLDSGHISPANYREGRS